MVIKSMGADPPQYHPAAPQIAKHCIGQLQVSSGPGGVTSLLHALTMLKDIIYRLPKAQVKVFGRKIFASLMYIA